jgi:hypothetical protein
MSNIAIQGAATGTGVFTLASPATNTDRTLVLPDEAGTVLTRAAGSPDNSVVVDASGNVGIGTNSPASYGKFVAHSSGGYCSIDSNGFINSTQSLDTATAGGRFSGYSNRGLLGSIKIEQATTGADGGYMAFGTCASGSTSYTERMRIDSAGRVTMPYQPVFSGNRDGKLIIVNTAGLIDFNSIVNTGSHWNTSTNTFTCPVAGRYFVSFYNLTNGGETTVASSVTIRRNGSNFYNAYTDGGTDVDGNRYWNSSASGVFDCQASDTITFYTSSGVVYGGVYCGATIYLIG